MGSRLPGSAANEEFGFPSSVGLGLLKVTQETLGISTQSRFDQRIAVLERDGEVIRTAGTKCQLELLGTAPEATPESEAMWSDDERHIVWAKQQQEKLRQIAQFHPDPDQLARELPA
jgi:hypothetical protein